MSIPRDFVSGMEMPVFHCVHSGKTTISNGSGIGEARAAAYDFRTSVASTRHLFGVISRFISVQITAIQAHGLES